MQDIQLIFACGTSIILNDTMLGEFTAKQVQDLQEYAALNKLSDIEKGIVKPLKFQLEDSQKDEVIENKNFIFEDISSEEITFVDHAFARYSERIDGTPPDKFKGYSYPEEIDKINKIIDFIRVSTMIETQAEYKGERVVRYNFIGKLEDKSVVISVKFEEFVIVITVINKKNQH